MYIKTLASAALLACGIGSAAYAQNDSGPSGKDQTPPKSPAATTTDKQEADSQKGVNSGNPQESARRDDDHSESHADRSSQHDSDEHNSSNVNRDRDRNDSDAHYREDGSRRSNDSSTQDRPRPSDADRSNDRNHANDRRDRDQQSSSWDRDRNDRDREDRDADNRDRDGRRDGGNRRYSIDRDENFRDHDGDSQDRHGVQFSTSRNGLIIADVAGSSLGGRIGLRSGDQILSVNGNRVNTAANFDRYLVARSGQRVPIVIWRNGQERTVYWTDNHQYDQGRETNGTADLSLVS